MDPTTGELFYGLDDLSHVERVAARLAVAAVLGALIGLERERKGKAAGLRTHMLIIMGSCLFVLVPLEAGVKLNEMARVFQGLATGIGFLGAGAILKMPEERRIQGLTTAADIWVTAAVGLAVGLGLLWPAVLAMLMAAVILRILDRLEHRLEKRGPRAEEK